jgi:hypothetical protein
LTSSLYRETIHHLSFMPIHIPSSILIVVATNRKDRVLSGAQSTKKSTAKER